MTEEDEPEIATLTASPDAETTILFTSHPEQGTHFRYMLQKKLAISPPCSIFKLHLVSFQSYIFIFAL